MECFARDAREAKVREDEGVIARTRGACAPQIRALAVMAAIRVTDTVHQEVISLDGLNVDMRSYQYGNTKS